MSFQFHHHHPPRHHKHHRCHNDSNHAASYVSTEDITNPSRHSLGNNQAKIFIEGNYRYIIANGIPNHLTGTFKNPITPQRYYFRMPVNPCTAKQLTQICKQPFGIAINGVVFDPEAAEFWNDERHSGWQYEALSGKSNFKLDANNAHVRANGTYHYHGLPVGLIAKLGNGEQMMLLGYAADGFPIYNQYGYSDTNNNNKPVESDSKIWRICSSYRLKLGRRPSGPGGQYDGTFVQDYEYVPGAGDLDECNGRFGVTPEYPLGIYHYYITEEFPFISRYFRGTPDTSFQRRRPSF